MAQNFMGSNVSFHPDADKQLEIQRKLKLAEALQTQGMQPLPEQRVPYHALQGLAKLAHAYVGKRQGIKAQDLAKSLGEQQQQRRGADTSLLVQALQGRQAQPAGLSEDAAGNVTPTDPMSAQTPVQSLGQALPMMQDPQMQGVGLQAMLGAQTREDQQQFQRSQFDEANKQRLATFQLQANDRDATQTRQQSFADQQNRQRAVDQQGLQQMMIDSRPQPAQRQQQIIQTPQGPMVLGEDGTAKPVMGPTGPIGPNQGRVGPMTATAQKELIETEEGIQGGQAALGLFKQAAAINDKAMGFAGAGAIASAGSILPSMIRPGAVDATQDLDNILQTAALPQLKAIFGGMPTEGERKILLDVQGSSSKPPSVRTKIFERAEKAIQARMKFGQEKAKRLREGSYFTGEGLPSIQMDNGAGQAPAPGEVKDGYRFKGGDPANPASWEQV